MSGILMSPEVDVQIRKRFAMHKRGKESPKFRELLRERFHKRIKAKRGALLEQFRHMGTQEVHNVITTIISEQVGVFREEINIEEMDVEEIPNETTNASDALEQHVLREYEKILEEELCHESEEGVICPLCEMFALQQIPDGSVICVRCSSQFPRVSSLQNMRDLLISSVQKHERVCKNVSQFALINDRVTSGLFLICQTCQYFAQTL